MIVRVQRVRRQADLAKMHAGAAHGNRHGHLLLRPGGDGNLLVDAEALVHRHGNAIIKGLRAEIADGDLHRSGISGQHLALGGTRVEDGAVIAIGRPHVDKIHLCLLREHGEAGV